MSLSQVDITNVTSYLWQFTGFANFSTIFKLQAFRQTLINTGIFLSASLIPQVIIGLLFAIGLRHSNRWTRIGRSLVILPWLIPTVAIAAVFSFIFNSRNGLSNYILESLHIISQPMLWFSDPGLALMVMVVINIWYGVPFNFLVIQSGLQAVPLELHEAAVMDGAGWWRELFSITIPLLKDSLFAVVMLGIIGTLKVFDFVWILTQGGPANGTMLPGPLAYQEAFVNFRYGVGSAVIVLTIVFMAAMSAIYVIGSSRGHVTPK